ncbi:MAG: hypothetical protein A4E49_03436 [Methanosaeta sp. PtaU1.Bin112]|nr:MAG: hypothetical protein A4E49_03436 [Methanosaeta sp. PtaU1.Bin112]
MPDMAPPAAPRKSITIIKAGRHWAFKHFFEDRSIFKELADYYDRDSYRFVIRTPGERNLVQKLLERRGFEVTLAESTRGYAVKLPRQSRYSSLLKDSLAMIETDQWRIFLMKDCGAAGQALRLGGKMVEVDVQFPI